MCCGRPHAFLKFSDRLIARFFLNLRSIYGHREPVSVGSRTTSSTLTSDRKRSFWRRAPTVNDVGAEVETRIYSSSASRSERDIPQGERHDLHSVMELQTRHEGDERVVAFAADSPPKGEA